ncbi:PQQ-dependent sugar dehydrogenase [Pseudomonas protegens]|uniref:PQQ-dependent sugar dehydrogenase n=1 Tax=Pseudomonas protegens TaxID=380021 RepID=UPI001B30445D|nr:sorbosone dehydrogenase family protein [Pseudomonas protegens]MBP5097546.1 sorbosone dehydrogenase family protein [Pseudomonas protegens]MBP5115583.1 sorbosone dehydrogenase family protein [Pseudomonas protegens]QEN49471.1 sorbosone dehydrogenase [Pseudomonas protegens]QTU08370.1 sorbosone dehydrogenase family protein [Pseudomonas protegens]QTU14679.1 sorbosone dehydrogenase family protein [Pseudomonas protegens]
MLKLQHSLLIAIAASLAACGETSSLQVSDGTGPNPKLPEPNPTLIPTVNIAPAIGWPQGAKPQAAAGTQVKAFAENLDHPRWLYVLPNGDVLVAETNAPPKPDDSQGIRGWIAGKVMGRAGAAVPSANRITLLRDQDHDGVAETRTVFLENLNSPFGMTLVGNDLYVADTDKLLRFPYQSGETQISAAATKVVDLPGGTLNHHWTKNVIASKDGSKLYVTVGSNSNVGENGLDKEQGRAAIWEVDRESGQHRLFATGLRNPNGLAWEPASGALWTAVNERDEIGSDLVPDYITSVKDGAFYGWPFSYYGQHVDVRVKPQNLDLVAKAIAPDYAVGPHTASLGLTFADGSKLPAPFTEGAFIGQHGSWNRKPHSGYKVIFVPFSAGKPNGAPIDVLSGFLNADEKAMGRPVGVVIDQQGGLLVADDVGNKIWRVSAAKAP